MQDIVEQLLDQWDETADARNKRLIRQAVLRAYRDLPNKTRWKYFDRRDTLLTSPAQSTGTIAYDHTGGANERQVTLTGSTWPADADFGRIIINDVHYNVSTRVSDTIITLEINNNPGADIAAGSTYQWYRSVYPLPVGFRKMGHIFDVQNEHEIALVTTDVHHAASIHFYDSPDTPWQAAIRNAGEYYNTMSLEFGPPPSSARYYDFVWEASPRDLLIEKYSTGTVSITINTTTLTLSGGTFPTSCVGSVVRLGTTANEPTSVIGSPIPRGSGTNEPFVLQRTIVARNSGTEVVLDAVSPATHTAVKFTISDPLDIDISAMFTALYRLAEYEFARYTRMEGLRQIEADFRQSLIEAMEADQRHTYARGAVRYSRFSRVLVSTDVG